MTAILDVSRGCSLLLAPKRACSPLPLSCRHAAAVCGPERTPIGCALALMLRRRGAAVVCVWEGASRRAAASRRRGPRRLAASWTARGLERALERPARVVALDRTAAIAAGEAARVTAAAGDSPWSVALCGPRDGAFDRMLWPRTSLWVAADDRRTSRPAGSSAALEGSRAPRRRGACARARRRRLGCARGPLRTPAARRALAAATGPAMKERARAGRDPPRRRPHGRRLGGLFLGDLRAGGGVRGIEQRAADLAALAGARAMREAYPRVFETGPRTRQPRAYEAIGRRRRSRRRRATDRRMLSWTSRPPTPSRRC